MGLLLPFPAQAEEEEVYDPFIGAVEALTAREYLHIDPTVNGNPLPHNGVLEVPIDTPANLAWFYTEIPPSDFSLPGTSATFEEALGAATFTLHLYKGTIGSSTRIASHTVSRGHGSGISLTFPESGKYVLALSATYPYGTPFPGFSCGSGDYCIVPESRIESFTWFMEHAGAYFRGVLPSSARYFFEDAERKDKLRSYRPIAVALAHIEVREPQPQGNPSVLFLPGIKGSRLYRPSDTCTPHLMLACPSVQLWEPSGNQLIQDLYLYPSGRSAREDVYVKEGDVMDTAFGTDFYASFKNQMDALVADGMIPAWRAFAYDWRLSLDALITNGSLRNGKIFFSETPHTAHLLQTIRDLAEVSPTGKVSIVAHSNGGLVAKRLLQELEARNEHELINSLILVGVPQTGAPQAIAALLFGFGEALPIDTCADNRMVDWLCGLLVSRGVARELAEHAPMAYHLLPSRAYLSHAHIPPVVSFSGTSAYAREQERYGNALDTAEEIREYLSGVDGGRTKPVRDAIGLPNILPQESIAYGEDIHVRIDSWIPPSTISVYQIAGTGIDTLSGIQMYEEHTLFGASRARYRPRFSDNGDGVVPAVSAHYMNESDQVKSFFVDLWSASVGSAPDRTHGTMLELDSVRILIRDLLLKSSAPLPQFISASSSHEKRERLLFLLHSPLTLQVRTTHGDNTSITHGMFGEVAYAIAPADQPYTVTLTGYTEGTFTFSVEHMSADEVHASVTFADVPTTETTRVTMSVTPELTGSSPLQIDHTNDGVTDIEIAPLLNETVYYPKQELKKEMSSARSSRAPTPMKEIVLGVSTTSVALPVIVAKTVSTLISSVPFVLAEERQLNDMSSVVTHTPHVETSSVSSSLSWVEYLWQVLRSIIRMFFSV